jgi:hypothetical protein
MLKPPEGGAETVAQSLVINDKIVIIKASIQIIAGTTITQKRPNDKAVEMVLFGEELVVVPWAF